MTIRALRVGMRGGVGMGELATNLIFGMAGILVGMFLVLLHSYRKEEQQAEPVTSQIRRGLQQRKEMIIDKLHRKGMYKASDGRDLSKLTAQELEVEYARVWEQGG
jgi:hypothetical protein